MTHRTLGRRLTSISRVGALAGIAMLVAFRPSGPSDEAAPQPATLLSPAALIEAGREQFTRVRHTEPPTDPKLAAHRLFNARSCAECHRQGGIGGGGPNENNVQLFDTAFASSDPQLTAIFGKNQGAAVLHRHGLAPQYASFRLSLIKRFAPWSPEVADPPSQQRLVMTNTGMVHAVDFGAVLVTEGGFSFSGIAERNTPPLFGLGLLETIAQSEIDAVALRQPKKIRGRSPRLKGGGFGRFGWKSSNASLLAFNENACAIELGLTTSNFTPATLRSADLLPHPRTAPEGMVGTHGTTRIAGRIVRASTTPPTSAPTLTMRAAAPPKDPDMSAGDVAALTRYVASLPAPRQVADSAAHEQVGVGERQFREIGCADCHTPTLGGVTGVYSDLLLHTVGTSGGGFYGGPSPTTPSGEPDFDIVRDDEFRTPPLWGVADSAPYLHDGSAATLDDAIRRHVDQAARSVSMYERLPHEGQALIAFLESLRAPQ